MTEAFAGIAIFTGILIVIALALHLLSRWHARIERQLRPQYPTISRADLDVEAANAECGIVPLSDHIRHRNKFEGRHYDAA